MCLLFVQVQVSLFGRRLSSSFLHVYEFTLNGFRLFFYFFRFHSRIRIELVSKTNKTHGRRICSVDMWTIHSMGKCETLCKRYIEGRFFFQRNHFFLFNFDCTCVRHSDASYWFCRLLLISQEKNVRDSYRCKWMRKQSNRRLIGLLCWNCRFIVIFFSELFSAITSILLFVKLKNLIAWANYYLSSALCVFDAVSLQKLQLFYSNLC